MSKDIEAPESVTEPVRSHRDGLLWAFIGELLLMAALIGVYELGRHLADGNMGDAVRNAHGVWRLERVLRLPDEAAVQHGALAWEPVARLSNLYYVGVHFPGTFLVLFWLFMRHRAQYLRVRTELLVLTAAGLAGHIMYPLAPPRLVPDFGLTDTMLAVGPSAYPAGNTGFANQYAAMPSLHVGWALLMAIAVIRVLHTPWRWLALLHPIVTTLVVVATANHYWWDGIVAAFLLFAAIVLVRRWDFGDPPTASRQAAFTSTGTRHAVRS